MKHGKNRINCMKALALFLLAGLLLLSGCAQEEEELPFKYRGVVKIVTYRADVNGAYSHIHIIAEPNADGFNAGEKVIPIENEDLQRFQIGDTVEVYGLGGELEMAPALFEPIGELRIDIIRHAEGTE